MAIFSGYIALGTSVSYNVLAELSGGTYARQALNLVGNFQSGANQSLSAFGSATAATVRPIRNGAIFDALTGGNQLCHWAWSPPVTQSTTAFPATVINLALLTGIAASASVSSAPIAAGSQVGTMNGNPLIAGCTLVQNGGVFVALGLSITSQTAFGALPITLPSSSGVLWNNGGVLSIS